MALQRNEILEIGNHIALHHGFEFNDDTMSFMGIIIEKRGRHNNNTEYGVYMEDGDTNDILDWRITDIQQFNSDNLDDSCIFVHETSNNEIRSYKYRNLTNEEMSKIVDAVNQDYFGTDNDDTDDIPF